MKVLIDKALFFIGLSAEVCFVAASGGCKSAPSVADGGADPERETIREELPQQLDAQPASGEDPEEDTGKADMAYVPATLDECFAELKKILTTEQLAEFKGIKEDDVAGKYHFGLGMQLRNKWGLWSRSRLAKYFNEMGIFHPDDMSGIILTSFHRHLNGKETKLEEQIKYYKDYWKKTSKNAVAAP